MRATLLSLIWGIFCICLAVFFVASGMVASGTVSLLVVGLLLGHGVAMAIVAFVRSR